MYRNVLHVLSAVCCTALLPAAAPTQSAGGDQLVRAQGGEYTVRLSALRERVSARSIRLLTRHRVFSAQYR